MDRGRGAPPRRPEQIQSEMEELFRALVNRQRSMHHQAAGGWRPHLEVYETARALVVRAELAGVDESSLSVLVHDQLLRLSGSRRRETHDERRLFHQMEISYGPFTAEVFVPFSVDVDHVSAVFVDGILTVTLPKDAPRRIVPRTVQVQSGRAPEGQET